MTAKEQGLPELPEGVMHMTDWMDGGEKVVETPYYTADQMRAYALAALASDTGERGVVVGAGEIEAALDAAHPAGSKPLGHYLNLGIINGFAGVVGPAFIRELMRAALTAALRAQPAGGGDIPQWALPAVESALAMLDEQGYAHTDLAAFRDWLKESTP